MRGSTVLAKLTVDKRTHVFPVEPLYTVLKGDDPSYSVTHCQISTHILHDHFPVISTVPVNRSLRITAVRAQNTRSLPHFTRCFSAPVDDDSKQQANSNESISCRLEDKTSSSFVSSLGLFDSVIRVSCCATGVIYTEDSLNKSTNCGQILSS